MIIIARTRKGEEFQYSYASAHRVPKSSARKICDALNRAQYGITPEQIWHVYEIDKYDIAYDFAEHKRFGIRNGKIYEGR